MTCCHFVVHDTHLYVYMFLDNSVNVLGYFKTCIVFIGGIAFFDTSVDLKNILGITLTMIGVLLYTYVQLRGQEAKQPKSNQAPNLELKVQEKV